MDYISRVPAPPLNAYIDDLYYIDGLSPYPRLKVSPMPSLHLMINLGPTFQVYAQDQAAPFATCTESWWIGLWNTYYIVDWSQSVRFYGVHFKPAGVYPFLRLPLSELRNQVVPADAIWGHFAAEIRERLYAAPTVQAGLVLLEKLLLARFTDTLHGLDVVQYAIAQIDRQDGVLSIGALSDHIGISQNHLGTQFKRIVGVTPKDLARFYRFAHVVCSIDPSRPMDWGWIVRKSGFYDLSHLNKDFVEFTGHSPSDYLRLRRRFHDENPNHSLDVGPLPTD
ncbi:MAG: helix-turn-helix domain-containing protein [Chloroflexi bacterium]|nr:helix-turn-helix domain-containing protein [Chloroflexota bacterium]